MKIDGMDYGTSSVTKGLARHRMAQADKAKQSSDKAGKPKVDSGIPSRTEHDHQGQAGDHEVIKQTVAAHGPAVEAKVDKEAEHHVITTTHGDGHTHVSKGHPDVAHAAEHLSQAALDSEGAPKGEGVAEDFESAGDDSIAAMGIE